MIKFNKLIIKNFMSIKEAELEYKSGLWIIKGTNLDSGTLSNGAGKTTSIIALHQCLYNKNPRGINIDNLHNRVTKDEYYLEVTFDKGSDTFKVINSRDKGIELYVNGIKHKAKGSTKTLVAIKDVLGVPYRVFCAMTFVSQKTVLDLMDSFSSSELVNCIIDFNSLTVANTTVKQLMKDNINKHHSLQSELQALTTSKEALGSLTYIDTTPFRVKLNSHISSKEKLIADMNNAISSYSDKYISAGKEKDRILNEVMNIDFMLNSAYCPTCNSRISDVDEKELQETKHSLDVKLSDCLAEIDRITEHIDKIKAEYNPIIADIDKEIESVSNMISVQDYKNSLYEEHKDSIENLNESLAKVSRELDDISKEDQILAVTATVLKNGDIHKSLLTNFCSLLNNYISVYIKYISISNFSIGAKPSKDSIEFKVYDSLSKSYIDLDTLSGGEITRLRIVVLLSAIKTIQVLSNTSFNFIVFDEALDTLDASASQDLNVLFSHMLEDEKFIGFISHGQQLDAIDFTGTIRAIKQNGLTTIKQETLDG